MVDCNYIANKNCNFPSGAKEEILANLANFAYDPINYDHFRELNVVDLLMGKEKLKIKWKRNLTTRVCSVLWQLHASCTKCNCRMHKCYLHSPLSSSRVEPSECLK